MTMTLRRKLGSQKVKVHQSTEMALERVTSHIKVTSPPCLFQLPPYENVKQLNNMSDVIYYLFMKEISLTPSLILS